MAAALPLPLAGQWRAFLINLFLPRTQLAQSKWGIPILLHPSTAKQKEESCSLVPLTVGNTKEKTEKLGGWAWPILLFTTLTNVRPLLLLRGPQRHPLQFLLFHVRTPSNMVRPGAFPALVSSRKSNSAGVALVSLKRRRTEGTLGPPHSQSL